MSDEQVSNYLEEVQNQIIDILNKVKEELGVDTPIDIEVREANDE